MEIVIITLLGFGLTVIVVALLLGATWLLRKMLPTSHALQKKLATAHLHGTALWAFKRIELWISLFLLASFTVATLVYS